MNGHGAEEAEEAVGSTDCTRCGTCCEKGGPSLHIADLDKVLEKKIAPENLYTIRKGEMVYDNVAGGLMKIDQEIIKIKPSAGSRACIYYEPAEKACTIYEIRPVECRAMNCRDTGPAEAMYSTGRIERKSVFGGVDWLMELIAEHEKMCGYDRIAELAGRRLKGEAAAAEEISGAVSYDLEIRRVVQEKTAMAPEMMDLVFGRSLKETLPARFGIKVMQKT